jgi:hypothetical protein
MLSCTSFHFALLSKAGRCIVCGLGCLSMQAVLVQKASIGQQIPMEHVTSKWTTLALDMHELLAQDSTTPFKCTKSIQFCANLRARGAFSSDIKYVPLENRFRKCSVCL